MILAITGPAGSGKDTVADYLVSKRGFTKIALADPMKRFCRELFGFTTEQLWGSSKYRNAIDPRWHVSPREVLQQLGTEWGRNMHSDVWITYLLTQISKLRETYNEYDPTVGVIKEWGELWSPPAGFVVTDCRFENEAAAIRKAGGRVVHLLRSGTLIGSTAGQHVSEHGIVRAESDFVIDNTGTHEDLWKKLEQLLKQL